MDNQKCSVRDGNFVEPCEHLRKACNGRPYGTAKGIFIHDLSYLDKERLGKPSRTFFSVKSGEYAKKGVALNFCPFCGVQIDAPFIERPDPPINTWIDWHYTPENPFPKLDGDPVMDVMFTDLSTSMDRGVGGKPLSYWATPKDNQFNQHHEFMPEHSKIIAYMILDPKDHD